MSLCLCAAQFPLPGNLACIYVTTLSHREVVGGGGCLHEFSIATKFKIDREEKQRVYIYVLQTIMN